MPENNTSEIEERVLKLNDVGAFVGIELGKDGYIEHLDWNLDGTEVYAVCSESYIDTQLDRAARVVRYTAWDGHGNEA